MNWKMLFSTRPRKYATVTAITLASLFIIYVIVGFLVIAPVAKWQLEKQLPPLLQRKVSIGDISLNPLTLCVQFENLSIIKKDDDGSLFSVAMLEAKLSGKSILAMAPIVQYVKIVKPSINITRYKDDRLSIDDIIEHQAQLAKESDKQTDTAEKKDGRIFPFKLLNFILEDGTIVFNDKKMNTVQTISKLSLAVPLTSSFPGDHKEAVQPKLSMLINGAPFDLDGSTYPFSENYLTKFSFSMENVPLARYWRYIPLSSPVAITSGTMKIDVHLAFSRPEGKPMDLDVKGGVELVDLGMTKDDKSPVLTVPRIKLIVKDFSLAKKMLTVEQVAIENPFIEVHREKDNSINWATYFATDASDEAKDETKDKVIVSSTTQKTEKTAAKQEPAPQNDTHTTASKNTEKEKPAVADRPFTVVVESLVIKKGKVAFKDSAVQGTFATIFEPVDLEIKNFSTADGSKATVALDVGEKKMISVQGDVSVSPVAANIKAIITDLSLKQFTPYIAEATPAQISSGALSAGATLSIASDSAQEIGISIADGSIRLQKLTVTGKGYSKAPITLGALTVDGAAVDVKKQSVSIAKISLADPDITLTRDKEGIDLATLFAGEAKKEPAKKSAHSGKKSSESPWKLQIQSVGVTNGKITFNDTALKRKVITHLKNVAITADNISLANTPSKFSVSTGVNDKSTIKADGTFTHSPLAVDGKIDVSNLNIPDFAGYIQEYSEVNIATGTVSTSAKTQLSVPDKGATKYNINADVTMNNVSAANKSTNEKIGSVGQIAIKSMVLDSDKNSVDIGSVSIAKPATNITREANGSLSIVRAVQGNQPAQTRAPSANSAAVVATTKPFGVSIGSIAIKDGSVTFQDASINPRVILDFENISASYKKFDLNRANSSPVNFSATLQGRRISASGAVNPMAKPFALDITAKIEDVGLKKFSPYTVKYIAYPVNTGALKANIKLKIQQNKLNAQNSFLFENFTLGNKNPNSKAPSVPIKLGLSLMRQPDGNISLDLPVTGDLNDPNFHISQLITKTLVNVIVKAAVSPFTVVSSLLGDVKPEDAKYVGFTPGYAGLSKKEQDTLNRIASILRTKKNVKLECLGFYNTDADVKGLKERAVKTAVIEKWYRTLSKATRKNIDISTVDVPKYKYAEYLTEAYEDAPDMPNNPRPSGLLGYKDRSVKQMEDYLRSTADTSQEALRKLALERANAVRDFIVKKFPELKSRVKAVQAGNSENGKYATAVQLKITQ